MRDEVDPCFPTHPSHRLRTYVLIGYPKDTFDQAEARLKQMIGIGFTPMAMLWSPDKPSQERYRPAPEWKDQIAAYPMTANYFGVRL